MRAEFSTNRSSSSTRRVAKPQVMARLLRPKVDEWTTQRSNRENTPW